MTLADRLEHPIFDHRRTIITVFALVTLAFAVICVRGLRIDASFTKQLPVEHEYMRTYLDPQVEEFRGANRVLIALVARDGNMFTPEFFNALKLATDEVIVMDGIDRGRVQSLYTPNVRYLEVVEDGSEAGNVVPADFEPTPAAMAQVRENILKAGIVGRLVATDFSGALVSAIVLDQDANGRPVDPIAVSKALEREVRDRIEGAGAFPGIDVHMIGFALVMGDIAAGALSVVVFAIVTLALTLLSVWLYCQSLRIALVPVVCSLVAVVWQLGVNDVLQMEGVEGAISQMKAAIETLRAHGLPVVLVDLQVAPMVDRDKDTPVMQAAIEKEGARPGILHFHRQALMRRMIESGETTMDDLVLKDGLHMSRLGHLCTGQLLAQQIAKSSLEVKVSTR